jgi:hypothetical protein
MPLACPGLLLGTSLLLLLGGCSGTPFGDQLARSFSNPGSPTTTPSTAPQAGPAAKGQEPSSKPPSTPVKPKTETRATPDARPAPAAPATALQPAPYRVTIKLPAADPSAPAEVVTQALRAAGVRFEVEMIERVRATGNAPEPTAPTTQAPAPAPR